MFGLFKSKRQKWKEKSTKAFDNIIPSIQGMDSQEIGGILDIAAKIKRSSLLTAPQDDPYHYAFNDPMKLGEERAFYYLEYWQKTMEEWAGTIEGNAKVGAMSIWWLSLSACNIAELRIRGRELWSLLERGFEHCNYHEPDSLIPNGLSPKIS